MTDEQKQQARELETYPFEPTSINARFVDRIGNYVRYIPHTRLTETDAKNLERLYTAYIRNAKKANHNG